MTDLLTAFQTRLSRYTGVHCRPDMIAFNEEKFFNRRHSYKRYNQYNATSAINILQQLR